MNKISLVSRRRDKAFDAPTQASLRARARLEEDSSNENENAPQTSPDISVTMEEGAQTIDLSMNTTNGIDPEVLAEEYLHGRDEAELRTLISKKKMADKWELKLQFMPERPSKLLSAKELSSMLGISSSSIYLLRKKGVIKGYQAGRAWRFMWSEVLEALEKTTGENNVP